MSQYYVAAFVRDWATNGRLRLVLAPMLVSDRGLIRYTTRVAVQNKPILDSNSLADIAYRCVSARAKKSIILHPLLVR